MRPQTASSRLSQPLRNHYRNLIHRLNQRYRQEFDRAERLQAELADIYASRAWRLLAWLRRLKRWVVRRPSSVVRGPSPVEKKPASETTDHGPRTTDNERVSIIIPFKDQVELLHGCLTSLRGGTYRQFEVILVDNGSTEAHTLRYLRRFVGRRRWRTVTCPGPFNFSHLCNQGARQASGDYLLFLNNDTEVLTPDWLEQLLAVARQPGVGIVGATLLYPDLTIQHAGIVKQEGTWIHAYRGCSYDSTSKHSELRQVRGVPAVTGACLLIRRDLFVTLGGFDERLPVTHNDVDLCRRVREQGLLVMVTPHAQLLHFESLSRGYSKEATDSEYQITENRKPSVT